MAAALALSMLIAVGAPQAQASSRLSLKTARVPTGSMSPAARARITLEGFARCVLQRNPKGVERALAMPMSSAGQQAVAALATNECMGVSSDYEGSRLSLNARLLRGALYAELVRRRVDLDTPPPAETPDLTLGAAPGDAAAQRHVALVRFGDCILRRDPKTAIHFVRENAETEAEAKDVAALMPSMGACVDQGAKVELSKPIVEAAVAEVIYLNTNAARAAGNS